MITTTRNDVESDYDMGNTITFPRDSASSRTNGTKARNGLNDQYLKFGISREAPLLFKLAESAKSNQTCGII